jgi:hypothetical protein
MPASSGRGEQKDDYVTTTNPLDLQADETVEDSRTKKWNDIHAVSDQHEDAVDRDRTCEAPALHRSCFYRHRLLPCATRVLLRC